MDLSRIKLLFLLIPTFFTVPEKMNAGLPFEGVITFRITYPGNKLSESQLALFPKALTVMIKGPKSRTDILTGAGSRIEITDHQEKTKIKLLNLMDQKYAIKYTSEDIAKEIAKEPPVKIELSDETKNIAGYLCKNAVITVNDRNGKYTINVYYTPEIGGKLANFDKGIYKDIDGVLMEFTMKTSEMLMRFTAVSVEKKTVSVKEFDIPSDYSIISRDDLKNKIGG
ncbi:MAG: hypothetical protein D4R97_09335 [Bacteroidetes bacterium]|nr:MAG: hypothetical protein D4R97_09335 [Bacteroidota bacterium]